MVRFKKRKFAIFTIVLGGSLIILQHWILQDKLPVTRDNSRHTIATKLFIHDERRRHNRDDLKLILYYTPLFGRLPWPGMTNDYNFTHWNHIPCGVQSCRISYNKSDLARSDAVLFHGRDMPSAAHMRQIAKHKTREQRWVYFIHESPKFTYYDPLLYNGFFNWTMSYRRDSDFFVPYRTYTRLEPDEVSTHEHAHNRNYAHGKDRLVAWVISHCEGLREDYVKKLTKYIKIDVYGWCSQRFNQTGKCPRASTACSNTLKRYKFILAFENSYCIDYITEKYWYAPLDHDIVPIVLGGGTYDAKNTIPGSFINVLDFLSVESLASYLLYLDRNDVAYNEFFSWRRHFKPVFPESWTCQMCAALHNDSMPEKIYHDMVEYWGERSGCEANERKVRQIIEPQLD